MSDLVKQLRSVHSMVPSHEDLFREAADRIEELEQYKEVFDALSGGLIQFGSGPDTRCYSVWGFDCRWHHDPILLKAIEYAQKWR